MRQRLEREFYNNDFWAFCIDLKIVPDLEEQPHREVISFLLHPDKYKLLLVPRDSFKSTIMVAFVLWHLAKDPNLRVLIDSRTADRAKELLFHVKEHIEKNERFRELFGDWKYIPGWREQSFVHPGRTKKFREPSIKVAGIDSPVTGGHYDLIIADDLHDESNSQSEISCNKAILHYKTLLPILEPHGQLIVVGTVWSHMDLYHNIMESDQGWTIMKRPARLEDGSLWFPARLTEEYLEDRKAKMGPYLFAAQFMLEAIAPEDRRFDPAWIVYREFFTVAFEGRVQLIVEGEPEPTFITLAVDPAISEKKGSDFSGLVTVATDVHDNWYVLNARRIRGGANDLLDAIVEEIRTWVVGEVGIETVAFQMALKEFLLDRLAEEGLQVSIKELISGSGRGKRARIEGLVPKFASGRVYFRKGMARDLEFEMLQWTPDREQRHDDLVDALSHQLTLALPAPTAGQLMLGSDWFDLPPDERERIRRKKNQELDRMGRPSAYGA